MGKPAGRILIVDDEPSLLKMMGLYLGRLGYSVTAATTPEKAWAEVGAAPSAFDVAVLDATMTGMSLDELAVGMLGAAPRLCVLAASGYPVDMAAMEQAAPGRVGFLPKPFTGEMLAAAIRRMLASQEKEL
jgi:two-component system, cell cycle sensor histidine kinase and response regulator CckA